MAEAEQVVRRSGQFPAPVQTAPMSAELLRLRRRYGPPQHLEPVWLVTWTGTLYAQVYVSPSVIRRYDATHPHANAVVSAVSGKLLFMFASP